MTNWPISLANLRIEQFGEENHNLVTLDGFLAEPDTAMEHAVLQKFAKIAPQYPGLRAPLPENSCEALATQLAPMLDKVFGAAPRGWTMQAWFSIVTTLPGDLIPLQRFPHVDGTDPTQIAMMLYLHRGTHGGTAFFRHRSTGFSSLTSDSFPRYQRALQSDVRRSGLPPACYATDGAPHFERIHASEGLFNQAVFYRGNILHSGIIDNHAPLPADPRSGRFSINAMLRPA